MGRKGNSGRRIKPQSALNKIQHDVRATPYERIRAALCVATLDAYDNGDREWAVILAGLASSSKVRVDVPLPKPPDPAKPEEPVILEPRAKVDFSFLEEEVDGGIEATTATGTKEVSVSNGASG